MPHGVFYETWACDTRKTRHSQILHDEIHVLRRYLTRHGMPERRAPLVVAEQKEGGQRADQKQDEESDPSRYDCVSWSCILQEHSEGADQFPSTVRNVGRARGQDPARSSAHTESQSAELSTNAPAAALELNRSQFCGHQSLL